MSLEALPNELLFSLAELLSSQRDLNAFARSSRTLYTHVNAFLYQRDAKSGQALALIWAAERGREGTAISVLEAGANANMTNSRKDKPTALHIACANGHLNVATILISRGASIQATTSKSITPLHTACFFKHASLVDFLLGQGASVSTLTPTHETPLHLALRTFATSKTSTPRPCPKFTWAYPISAHHKAPSPDSTLSTISVLLAHGASPFSRDRGGTTPEHLAKQHYDPEVRALMRRAVAVARCSAERQPESKTRERKETLERAQLDRLSNQREEIEAMEKEVRRKMRVEEEKRLREREAETQREERLVSGRQGWSRLRELGDQKGRREMSCVSGSKGTSSVFAFSKCKHSSLVWLKKRGKGHCRLCSKGCAKHSFLCPDCGLEACTTCKANIYLD